MPWKKSFCQNFAYFPHLHDTLKRYIWKLWKNFTTYVITVGQDIVDVLFKVEGGYPIKWLLNWIFDALQYKLVTKHRSHTKAFLILRFWRFWNSCRWKFFLTSDKILFFIIDFYHIMIHENFLDNRWTPTLRNVLLIWGKIFWNIWKVSFLGVWNDRNWIDLNFELSVLLQIECKTFKRN